MYILILYKRDTYDTINNNGDGIFKTPDAFSWIDFNSLHFN
jgi:hypothetical protein